MGLILRPELESAIPEPGGAVDPAGAS